MNTLLKTILDNISNIVIVVDAESVIQYANPGFGKLINRRAIDFIGQSSADLPLFSDEPWPFLLNELRKDPDPARSDFVDNRKKNEELKIVDPLRERKRPAPGIAATTVITLGDQIYSYQIFDAGLSLDMKRQTGLILNDLTRENDFLSRMSQAENMSCLKTLAAGICHEMSNPLHAVLTFSEALLSTRDPEKTKSYAEKVVENSKRIQKSIEDLSDYVQSKNNGQKQELDVVDVLERAIHFALLPFAEQPVAIVKNYQSSPVFHADAQEFQQIIINILSNALQAMKGKGEVAIDVHSTDENFHIVIKDNGPGISSENIKRIFNPFFTTKMQGEGTGLGLSIVHSLVEKYKGSISIQSEPDKGTSVDLRFPLHNAPAKPQPV